MKEYVALKSHPLDGQLQRLREAFPLTGAEVYCADLVDREKMLYESEEELAALAASLKKEGVCRLHGSYWASPSAFLCGLEDAAALFGGKEETARYYSDLTGGHLFRRWRQEYALACALDAQAYTFHLIDYFPIDGLWRFSLTRQQVLSAMADITARLLKELEDAGLLSADSPRIELENAGWGLEYGAQTAEDFAWLLAQVPDQRGKLCVAWDVNHLLHAVGVRNGRGVFLLPEDEVSPRMRALQERYGADPDAFAWQWVRENLTLPALEGKVACVHLSDCAWKEHQFFTQGYLEYPWRTELEACAGWAEKEHYGEQLVLTHYDSHLPLGQGILPGGAVYETLCRLDAAHSDFALLHELKNTRDLLRDLAVQRNALLQK